MKRIAQALGLALVVLFGLAACQGQAGPRPTPTPPPNGALTPGIVPSARALLPRAVAAATKWQADAYLVDIFASIGHDRIEEQPNTVKNIFTTSTSFEFASSRDTQHSYAVRFESDGAMIVFTGSGPLSPEINIPIQPGDWPLDSGDAWQVALANGGNQQLEQSYKTPQGSLTCSIELTRRPPQTTRVVWDVSCDDDVAEPDVFGFWIDAQSGKLLFDSHQ